MVSPFRNYLHDRISTSMLQMLVYRRISWYHPQFLASSTQVGLSRIWWFSQHWSSIFIEDFPARHVGWVNHHFNPTRFPWYSYDIPMIILWYSPDHQRVTQIKTAVSVCGRPMFAWQRSAAPSSTGLVGAPHTRWQRKNGVSSSWWPINKNIILYFIIMI